MNMIDSSVQSEVKLCGNEEIESNRLTHPHYVGNIM